MCIAIVWDRFKQLFTGCEPWSLFWKKKNPIFYFVIIYDARLYFVNVYGPYNVSPTRYGIWPLNWPSSSKRWCKPDSFGFFWSSKKQHSTRYGHCKLTWWRNFIRKHSTRYGYWQLIWWINFVRNQSLPWWYTKGSTANTCLYGRLFWGYTLWVYFSYSANFCSTRASTTKNVIYGVLTSV